MRNPEKTRKKIISTASRLFNIQGYKATSISDITKAAELTKGAVYSHFENKSELEKASLVYMTQGMVTGLTLGIRKENDVVAKMNAIFEYFKGYTLKEHVSGGCPILNASIEADDTNPELRNVLNVIVSTIITGIIKVLKNGQIHGQIKKESNVETYANLLFSSIEGAIMVSKITGKQKPMETVIDHLKTEFNRMLV